MEVTHPTCSIADCSKPLRARGWCVSHHQLWRKNGDPLIKLSPARGSRNAAWKGENAGYNAMHYWVKKRLGPASNCENCGTKDTYRYEWANMSGEYQRDLSDWVSLCVRCHRWIDNNVNKSWAIRKSIKETI